METIDEQEFRRICEDIRTQEVPTIFQAVADSAERTQLILRAVFRRVCSHLKLDFEAQQVALKDNDGFALFQTLEEHMKPEFFYSGILDQVLLRGV